MIYENLKQAVDETIKILRTYTDSEPTIGIILGTGLSGFIDYVDVETEIDYKHLPYFPISTVESHSGKLIFGKIGNKKVVAMQGRFHFYEGYTLQQITYPIRVMKEIGVKNLIISNAAGSLNPLMKGGSLMIIDDHINLMGDNPLIGKYDQYWGPRFVDMSEPYSQRIIKIAENICLENRIKIHKGVYCVINGPSLETRAEYRFLRQIGADAVGMSTIPECIVARQMGMEVFAVSVLTDECYPDALKPFVVEEIIANANAVLPDLNKLFNQLVLDI